MPYIAWINEIFPETQGPFDMTEIRNRLQRLYSPRISRSAVYRALHSLEGSEETEKMVRPVKPARGRRPAFYSYEGARRIGRRVTHDKAPDRLFEPAGKTIPEPVQIAPKSPRKKVLKRKRNTTGTQSKKAIARKPVKSQSIK